MTRVVIQVIMIVLASEGIAVAQACMSMNSRRYHKERASLMMESGLAFIEYVYEDPYDMFNSWLSEAMTYHVPTAGAMTLATATREGKVSARTMMLKRVDEDGFVFVTVRESQKTRNFAENPYAELVFKWEYKKRGKNIIRQVRVEGKVEAMLAPEYATLYDEELLYRKLQYHVMQAGQRVDWQSLKDSHDNMWMSVVGEGRTLPMPDNYAGYKVVPDVFEFYHSEKMIIPDRVVYMRDASNEWEHQRIAA